MKAVRVGQRLRGIIQFRDCGDKVVGITFEPLDHGIVELRLIIIEGIIHGQIL